MALGEDGRPPGATIATLSGAVFALAAAARVLPRPGRRRFAGGRRGRLLAARRLRRLRLRRLGQAPGRRHDHPDRRLRARGRRRRRRGRPDPSAEHRPPRVRAAASDIEGAAGAELVFASGDNLDGWIDQVVSRERQRRQDRRPRRRRPGHAPWGDQRRGGVDVRPSLVARSAQRRGRRRGDPRQPGRGGARRRPREFRAQRRRLPERSSGRWIAASPSAWTRCPPRSASWSPTTTPSVTSRSATGSRWSGAVIPSQTTQAQPSAKDVSDLVDLIKREGVTAVFPESSRQPQAGADDRPGDRCLLRSHALRRHARARRARAAPPTCRWRPRTPTRWCRASAAASAAADTGDRMSRPPESRGAAAPARRPDGDALARRRAQRRVRRARRRSRASASGFVRASVSRCWGRTAAARRRCFGRSPARPSGSPGSLRVNAPCATVPQTERSRLDYPVSALDVALMGALAGASLVAPAGPPRARGGA